ncbi:MAG: site-specific DNA-methyltransferase [Methylobacterium sp.]|nr:site-specific DNA-methyltransferase [Methylobacterium sp.]
MPDASIDSVVTDPPYALVSIVKRFGGENAAPVNNAGTKAGNNGDPYARAAAGFMGKKWDTGETAFSVDFWREVLRVLKPGEHLIAFGGTRTYHRLAVAIEDAGFEIRDQIGWLYGSGFPKSHDVSKAIDKAAGAEREIVGAYAVTREFKGRDYVGDASRASEVNITAPATDAARQWQGWGTALKPAWEPIVLARKPLIGTVAANVLAHGTGAINVDGCRVGTEVLAPSVRGVSKIGTFEGADGNVTPERVGRWPANICHDGSEEVLAAFPDADGAVSNGRKGKNGVGNWGHGEREQAPGYADTGSAARFFYQVERDEPCTNEIASDAELSLPQSKESVVFALKHAVARSTPPRALQFTNFRALFTNVTAAELRSVCEIVTEMMQVIARKFLRGSPLQNISLTNNLAECAGRLEPTGTMTITASHLKSGGFADLATFSITQRNSGRGEADCAPRRFHYSSKADASDRLGSKHPTVKPVDLMAYLCRLVTPPGGTVLDPFAGSGSTGMACMREGFNAILIEREAEYVADIKRRIAHVQGLDAPLFGGTDTPPPKPGRRIYGVFADEKSDRSD